MGAIDSVFGDSHRTNKLVVGSIKSNIGHLESTAALAGIIKTVEALERGQIPPQMNFEKPNPKIDWDRVQIPTTVMSWPPTRNGVRRAGVNSFGFGGTNGHAVLEYHPVPDTPQNAIGQSPFLFKVSAANESSLVDLANAYAEYVERTKPSLVDLSHTLLARRSTLKKSAYLVACSHEELVNALKEQKWKTLTLSNNPIQKIAFVFTGQGAQWYVIPYTLSNFDILLSMYKTSRAQMGKQLLEISPLFRAIISACDEALAALPDGPAWSIADELKRPKETSRLSKASFAQPICSALQIGLVELWKSWGITPHAVVGHSSGEIGAAYSAGFLSLRDAIVIAYYRGLYLGENAPVKNLKQRKGAMCAVGLGEANCAEILQKYASRISLAAVNSPSSCTLSGDVDAIAEVVSLCAEKGTFCRALRVDMG
jgi:acyl transferase domain-containing protein